MGVFAVAREWFECALEQSRTRTDRRAIGERLVELAEQEDFHEYHELHGSPSPRPPPVPSTTLPTCPTCGRPLTDTAPLTCRDRAKHGALVAAAALPPLPPWDAPASAWDAWRRAFDRVRRSWS